MIMFFSLLAFALLFTFTIRINRYRRFDLISLRRELRHLKSKKLELMRQNDVLQRRIGQFTSQGVMSDIKFSIRVNLWKIRICDLRHEKASNELAKFTVTQPT
jgi:hypothetical protein